MPRIGTLPKHFRKLPRVKRQLLVGTRLIGKQIDAGRTERRTKTCTALRTVSAPRDRARLFT